MVQLYTGSYWSLANCYGVKVERNVSLLHRSKTRIRQPQVRRLEPRENYRELANIFGSACE